MLSDFLSSSLSTTDKKSFWTELEEKLKVVLQVDTAYPVLRGAGNGQFIHWSGSATPFGSEGDFVNKITKLGNRPIMRDELEASQRVDLSVEEKVWLNANRVALILPMVVRSQLIGFLGIGSKREQRDFEVADFEILQSLSSQIAVAGENIMLLEESVEKKRLEAELSIARKVQEGMLPQHIPPSPGLEIAARSRFCTEVAGDYYDVIVLNKFQTAMAIGDVSGKGAGAALLMSNVQASFRMAIGIESKSIRTANDASISHHKIGLSSLMSNINDLICESSQPEQFITFFAAVYDCRNEILTYVNAGHNPPLLISKDGDITELPIGGILLGAADGMMYDEGKLKVIEGDLIFLYTDGLSEATNVEGEMFGEERIKEFLAHNRNLSPELILQKLEEEVIGFTKNPQLSDDFTLLAARVVRHLQM
jgi:sigma-B regulation protein RsbU (phosphoserine phosphatase)